MSGKTESSPEDVIASYQAAYVAARKMPAPVIVYEKGWYRFVDEGIYSRGRSLNQMRDRLLAVAKGAIQP